MIDPDHPLAELLRRDRRYHRDAYFFVFEALPPELAELEDTALRPDVVVEDPPNQSEAPHADGEDGTSE